MASPLQSPDRKPFAGQRATGSIGPVRVTHYDPDLHADVRSVVGYRATCKCRWRSSTMPTFQAARAALVNHRETHTTGAAQ